MHNRFIDLSLNSYIAFELILIIHYLQISTSKMESSTKQSPTTQAQTTPTTNPPS
jgi:hypothetical protein